MPRAWLERCRYQARMDFPTAETAADWDDANLFAALGYHAATRARSRGFQSLNEPERTLCCLFNLLGLCLNGGTYKWIAYEHPHAIGHAAAACERIGSAAG